LDESVSIGHPAEFFRELSKLFTSVDTSLRTFSPEKKLELSSTPLEGVARFEEALRGRCFYAIVRGDYRIAGVVLVLAALAGIMAEFLFFNVEGFLNLAIVGGLFAVFLAGGVALGVSRKQFYADLWLSFEGEAYQAKTLEPMGERASVFSRALLKTGWIPAGETGKLPLEFTKTMEESQLKLDLDIAVLLPQFELEPPKIADGKEYYGVLEDRRMDLSVSPE
jgi:hypothetical protein